MDLFFWNLLLRKLTDFDISSSLFVVGGEVTGEADELATGGVYGGGVKVQFFSLCPTLLQPTQSTSSPSYSTGYV